MALSSAIGHVKEKFMYKRIPRIRYLFIPYTPAGSPLYHLRSKTRDEAVTKLLKDVAHMPYKTWDDLVKKGYTIHKIIDPDQWRK
jgi:hypothetical protein